MNAPSTTREYIAAAGSAFTKADAKVIGPQPEAMSEDGVLDPPATGRPSESSSIPPGRNTR